MAKKNKQPKAELDMETTVADMNVEGFSWYNPNKKKKRAQSIGPITRKEYWAMVKGAFAAVWPLMVCTVLGAALMFLFAYIWLM